uniref:DnaJ homolog subfamily C member 17 n=1 Tax=Biomphalaria glabrata TaxID=6526 RepID=A0A2C9JI44_BIOGL
MSKDIYKKNLYGIIGVIETASEKEILRGYRKKALLCHPDKNPDNPKAAELFHELSQALEILTDAAARAAYDQTLKAKKAVEARNQVLDSKRKKFKEDLEAREKASFEKNEALAAAEAERKVRVEIERLRKEGSRLLEQEQQRLREEIKQFKSTLDQAFNSNPGTSSPSSSPPRIKLKWKANKDDITNGGYNNDNLHTLLSCYGKINTLFVTTKRKGSAIVEFDRVSSDILSEHGHQSNPLTLVWLSGKPCENLKDDNEATIPYSSKPVLEEHSVKYSNLSGVSEPQDKTAQSDNDFESLVLMRMRQAEERKKLIEQMMKEDND